MAEGGLGNFFFNINRPVSLSYTAERDPDDVSINNWIKQCMGVELGSYASDIVNRNFYLDPDQEFFDTSETYPSGIRPPLQIEEPLIELNNELTLQSIQLKQKIRSSFFFWELSSVVSIILGMITTILVSISATDQIAPGRVQRIIKLLAIVFPALGTAAAAILAFYSPQTAWSQASRTLASESQLHDQISLGLWNLKCAEASNGNGPNRAALATALAGWSKQYFDIQAISSSSGSAGGPGSSNGSSNATDGSAPAGGSSKPSN